jgi:hypothetical protein
MGDDPIYWRVLKMDESTLYTALVRPRVAIVRIRLDRLAQVISDRDWKEVELHWDRVSRGLVRVEDMYMSRPGEQENGDGK